MDVFDGIFSLMFLRDLTWAGESYRSELYPENDVCLIAIDHV